MVDITADFPLLADFYSFGVPFLLVFALVYALLAKTEYLSDSRSVNSVIAFAMAFMVALSGLGRFLLALTPFFAAFLVIIFGIFILLAFIGYKPADMLQSKGFIYTLIISGIIFVAVTSYFFYTPPVANETVNATTNITGPKPGCDYSAPITKQTMWCMITHPKIMGLSIVVIIMSAVSWFFTRKRWKETFE